MKFFNSPLNSFEWKLPKQAKTQIKKTYRFSYNPPKKKTLKTETLHQINQIKVPHIAKQARFYSVQMKSHTHDQFHAIRNLITTRLS